MQTPDIPEIPHPTPETQRIEKNQQVAIAIFTDLEKKQDNSSRGQEKESTEDWSLLCLKEAYKE